MCFIFVDRAGAKSIWNICGHVALRLIHDDHRVYFVFFDDGYQTFSQEVPVGVEVITIRVPAKKYIWDLIPQHLIFAREFHALLRRVKPDVVHTNFAVPSIVARWVAAREGVPCIVSTQHELYGSMSVHLRWGLRLTDRYCSAITYVSQTVARSFGWAAGSVMDTDWTRRPAHVVIPNGIDLDKIRTVIADAPPRVPAKLVCAGRMVPVKGQALLLRALHAVVEHQPTVRLKLIGSGPQEAGLRGLTSALGLEHQVEFAGWLPHEQVLREMASAALVVVPSDGTQEGFGLVVAEALACGTPVVLSDIPVFREVLGDTDPGGGFFSAGDAAALAERIMAVLSDFESARRRVAVARERARTELSAERMVRDYLALYQRIIEQK